MNQVRRSIFALAIPAIVANITTPLLGLVDMAIVGHLGKADIIAAIAVGGSMFSMLYWLFAFLRMTTGGMVAQAHGRSDITGMSVVFWRALLVAVVAGCLLIAFSPVLRGLLLDFMGAEPTASGYAAEYFDILVWGAPAFLSTYVLNGWFIGSHSTKRALAMSVSINVINIIASLVFVYLFNLGIVGVALGSLVAQWLGFAVGILLAVRQHPVRVTLRQMFASGELKRFASMNLDIFLRTLCLVAVTVWFTRAGARQGDMVLAVNALLLQFFLLFSYFMDGFAYAGEALVGSAVGASDERAECNIVRQLMVIGLIASLVFVVIYTLGGEAFLGVLTDNGDVIAASAEFRWWAVSVPFVGFSAFVWDGVFIGATRTRAMFLSMVVAAALFFALYYILFPSMGNHALWLAFVAYLGARGLLLGAIYRLRRDK